MTLRPQSRRIIGAGSAVLAIAIALLAAEWQAEGRRVEQQARDLAQHSRDAVQASRMPREDLVALPAADQVPGIVARLHRIAGEVQLRFTTAQYRWVAQADGRPPYHTVTLPFSAGYGQVREFLARAMNEVPSLALLEYSAKREDPGAAQLETVLRFAIYVRDGS